jgi:hypothetical protein
MLHRRAYSTEDDRIAGVELFASSVRGYLSAARRAGPKARQILMGNITMKVVAQVAPKR